MVKHGLTTAHPISVHIEKFSFSTWHLSCTKNDLRSSMGFVAQSLATLSTKSLRKGHRVFWAICWHTSPTPRSAPPLLPQTVHTDVRASVSDRRVGPPPEHGIHNKTCIFEGVSRTPPHQLHGQEKTHLHHRHLAAWMSGAVYCPSCHLYIIN